MEIKANSNEANALYNAWCAIIDAYCVSTGMGHRNTSVLPDKFEFDSADNTIKFDESQVCEFAQSISTWLSKLADKVAEDVWFSKKLMDELSETVNILS